MQVREKVGKSRNTMFFQWFVALESRKVGSLKRRARSHLARWEMKNCTLLWREAHVQVKMHKTPHVRTTFGSYDVEQAHAVVVRSTFPSQNLSNTPGLDHFWKLRCRKSARCCGVKHISKSKSTKHTRFGPLLEVEMSKKCTPLWREAHFEVKMLKAPGARTTFGRSDVVSCGRRKGLCTLSKVSNTWRFWSIFNYNHHYTPLHSNILTTTTTTPSLHSTTLHYTPLRYSQLHSITLHYTTLHYTTQHSATRHCITLYYTPLHYTTLHSTTLHSTTLQLHCTTLHSTLHYTTLRYIPLHYNYNYNPNTLHNTTLHYNYSYNYDYTTLMALHYTTITTTTATATATTTTTTTTLH